MLFKKLPRFECVFRRFANRALVRRSSALINMAAAKADPVLNSLCRRGFLMVFFGRFNGRCRRHELAWIEYPFWRPANRAFVGWGRPFMNKAAAYAYPVIETLCCHNASPFYCIVVPEHPPPGILFNGGKLIPPAAKEAGHLFGIPCSRALPLLNSPQQPIIISIFPTHSRRAHSPT